MGIYFNTGQACNAGSRLFVHKDQFDQVVGALAEQAAKAKVGPGLDPQTMFGPVVSQEQRDRVLSYIESGREQGAELRRRRQRHRPARLLRRADAVHRDQRRPPDRARGDLRARARGAAVRVARGGSGARQRHRLRPRRRRMDPRSVERAPARRDAQGRLGVRQLLGRGRPRRCRSAATRPPGSAASTAARVSTRTSRPRPYGPKPADPSGVRRPGVSGSATSG